MLLVWGDFWAVYERGRVWCLVRETCEYHSRGEEYIQEPGGHQGHMPPQVELCTSNLLHTGGVYGVILERPVGTTAD